MTGLVAGRTPASCQHLEFPWLTCGTGFCAGEAKSLKKPPPGVDDITAVVIILLEGNPKDKSWGAACKVTPCPGTGAPIRNL